MMGFFLLGPLLAVPPLAATLAYDTGVPVSAEIEDGAVRSRDQQLSTAAEAGCAGGGALGFNSSRALCMVTLYGMYVLLLSRFALWRICISGAALVIRTTDAGEDLRVAVFV